MADRPSHPPRRRRKWLWITSGVVIVLLLIVALLPTFITWGLANGWIRSSLSKSINGEVKFDRMRLGWFGDQSISNLRVIDTDGRDVANLDITVDAPLWSIAWNRPGPLEVTISGTVDAAVREDGSLTVTDLIASKPGTGSGQPRQPAPPEPFRLPDLAPLAIKLDSLNINITNLQTRQRLELQQLNGWVAYESPSQPISLSLRGQTNADGVHGTLALTGEANQVFNADGGLALKGATVRLDGRVESMPLPLLPGVESPATLRTATLNVLSDDLTGRIIMTLEARGQIEGQPESYLHAQASVANVLNTFGELELQGGSAHVNVTGQNLPWNAQDLQGMISQLKVTVVSNDLTETIVMSVDSNAQLAEHAPTTLTASMSMDHVLSADGTPTFTPEKLTGTVQGSTVPTSILDPMFANSAVVPSRDLGPVADVNASFSSGATREISVDLEATYGKLETRASVDTQTQAIRGTHLILEALAHPELVRGLTSIGVDQRVPLMLRLTSFVWPPADPQLGRVPLTEVAATGILSITGPASFELPAAVVPEGEPAPAPTEFNVTQATLEFTSPALKQHLDVQGTGIVDGGKLEINHRLTQLFDSAGQLAVINAQPVGTLTLTNYPANAIVRFAPQQEQLINELIGEALNASVTTQAHEQGLSATLQANAAQFSASATAIRSPDMLQVLAGRIDATISPHLLALVQQSERPVTVTQPARAALDIQPFDMPLRTGDDAGPFSYTLPNTPISVAAEVSNLVAENVPAFAEPVGISNLLASVAIRVLPDGWTSNTRGDVILRRPANDQNVAAARYVIDTTSSGEQLSYKLDLRMVEVAVRSLEQMLGQPRGAISQWTGDTGDMIMVVEGAGETQKAFLRPIMERFKGEFTANIDAQTISLTGRTTEFVLSRRALEKRLNVSPEKDAATPQEQTPAGRIRVPDNVPLALTISKLQIPRAALAQEPFDPAAALIDISCAGGPARVISPDGADTSLKDLDVKITTSNLSQGVKFAMNASATTVLPPAAEPEPPQTTPANAVGTPRENNSDRPRNRAGNPNRQGNRQNRAGLDQENEAPPQPANGNAPRNRRDASQQRAIDAGKLEVTGTILDLLSENDTLNFSTLPATAKVRLNATASDVPTAIADAFANMQGLLTAALGPVMNAKFNATEFSTNTGQLDARIETSHSWLEATVQGRDNSLRIVRNKPLKAELALSEELRERLLHRVHPILADIRTVERPIRANIPWAVAPVNPETGSFDISQLGSNIELEVGRVQFDSGSRTLSLLRFFGEAEGRETIPGEIEPISAKIRNGILTYDRFVMKISRYSLAYSGQINLVEGTVNLRTELPLEALAHSIQELEPYADRIIVPLVTRGSFGDLKTQIDPDFDIGKAALDAGVSGGLQQLLRDKGGVQGLLDQIIKSDK